MRRPRGIARPERRRGGRGIIGLAWPRLGVLVKQLGEAPAGFLGFDRHRAGRRRRGMFRPFRQPSPDVEPGRGRAGGRRLRILAERAQHRGTPGPTASCHRPGDRAGIVAGRPVETPQQRLRTFHQTESQLVGSSLGPQTEGLRDPARCRHAELNRVREGEQLKEIVAGEGVDTKAARRRRAVTDQRARAPANSVGRFRQGQ